MKNYEYSEDIQEVNTNKIILAELKKCLDKAIHELYLKDSSLILRRPERMISTDDIHVCERSVVFRFGIYLQNQLNKNKLLRGYDLDNEYNRNIYEPKRLPGWANGCYPDLIIHKRMHNTDNLLVIEIKAWWSDERIIEQDRIKIYEFVQSDEYRYRFGLLLIFEREQARLEWVESQKIF